MADNGFDGAGTYNNWKLTTTENTNAKSHNSGYEFEARENLGFLGNFMGAFNMFANFSHKNVKQTNKDKVIAMPSFSSNTWSGGINVSAYRASFTAKVVYMNELWDKAGQPVVIYGADQAKIQMYNVTPAAYNVKLDFDYQISKIITFFASADNVTNTKRITYRQDTLGITPAYARVVSNYEFGMTINAGIRAQF